MPCPTIDGNPESAKATADWIVEGTVMEIQNTGSFGSCELMPTPSGTIPQCSSVNKPERIKLVDAVYTRGEGKEVVDGEVTIVRKAHCFSGKLSSMNTKPELRAIGKRVRFYGNDNSVPNYIQAGYFWVEVLQ
jgi:hypothetical protein